MYKGKRKVLMKVLSLALAAGMSVSGLPVSALAAETADADVQEEAVVEPETAIEPAEDSHETQEAEVPSEVEEAAPSEVEEAAPSEAEDAAPSEMEEEVSKKEEEEVPEEEVPAEEKEEQPEESIVVNDAKKAERAEAPAKNGDGWDANHEKYYVNGEPVCDTVMEIDGEYYGFDYEGYMERNTMFPIYDEEA